MGGRTRKPLATSIEAALDRVGLGSIVRALRRSQPLRRAITIALLIGLLVVPLLAVTSAYQDYEQMKTLGQDAVKHLLNAKDAILPSSSSGAGSTGGCSIASVPSSVGRNTAAANSPAAGPAASVAVTATPTPGAGGAGGSGGSDLSIPDSAHLDTALREFRMAKAEFQALADQLDFPNPTLSIAAQFPSMRAKIVTVRQLVYVGDDASTIGVALTSAVIPLLSRLHDGALSTSGMPLVSPAEANQLRASVMTSISLLDDIQHRVGEIQPSDMPVSACQRAEFLSLTAKLGEYRGVLAQAPALFDLGTWALGVDQPRSFLIQTMDRGELRPTGGFTGDFGILTLVGGRVQPFELLDVDAVYRNSAGYHAPAIYEWWPFSSWGLRDSNLSPDFPTTARMDLQLFKSENVAHVLDLYHPQSAKNLQLSHGSVDGVISFTIAPIAHVLLVTGQITVPKYGDVLTAANFEDRLHYYQQDPAGIQKETRLSPDLATITPRKRFTYIVTKLLEDRVRHLSLGQLTQLGKIILADMRAHEIQVYMTNPPVESLLLREGAGGQLSAPPGQDTLMVDQANVSVSKASPYIRTALRDNVALDTRGGATHTLTMTLYNDPTGPYYGFSTYHDYVRFYVPAGSQLVSANGFDTGQPVCWVAPPWNPKEKEPARFKALAACPGGLFPDRSLVCPSGQFGPGPWDTDTLGGDSSTDWPVDNTGGPTNTTSDVSGLAMFGGYVTIPANCTATISLNWYVPHVAAPDRAVSAKSPAYTYHIQRQAGTYIALSAVIQPAAVAGVVNKPARFGGTFSSDVTLVIPRVPATTPNR